MAAVLGAVADADSLRESLALRADRDPRRRTGRIESVAHGDVLPEFGLDRLRPLEPKLQVEPVTAAAAREADAPGPSSRVGEEPWGHLVAKELLVVGQQVGPSDGELGQVGD